MRDVKDSEFYNGQKLHRGEDQEIHIFCEGSEESICGESLSEEVDAHRCNCRACVERFRDEYDSVSREDRVKFVDVHHAMNEDLKKMEGSEGIARTFGLSDNEKVLVDFGKYQENFWINIDRLEIVEKFDEVEEDE